MSKLIAIGKFILWPPLLFYILMSIAGFAIGGIAGQILFAIIALVILATDNPILRGLIRISDVTHG